MPSLDNRNERLALLLEELRRHAPTSPFLRRLEAASADESIGEKELARDCLSAFSTAPGPVPNAVMALMTQMSRATRELKKHGRLEREIMVDPHEDSMHRHVKNLNAALSVFPRDSTNDHAMALAFLTILVPLEGLLTDQLMEHNLKPLMRALDEIKNKELRDDVIGVVQLRGVHASGLGIHDVVNAWRHANFHWDEGAFHHRDAPADPFTVDDLARYATHGLAMWKGSQIVFALLLMAGE